MDLVTGVAMHSSPAFWHVTLLDLMNGTDYPDASALDALDKAINANVDINDFRILHSTTGRKKPSSK